MLKLTQIGAVLLGVVLLGLPVFSEEPVWKTYAQKGYQFVLETNYKRCRYCLSKSVG